MRPEKRGSRPDPDLETAVGEYYDTVWSYALFLTGHSREAAEEITQNVFLCLIEKWEKISKENIGGWLFGTTRLKYYEYVKARMKEKKNTAFVKDTDESAYGDPIENIPVFDEYFAPDDDVIEEAKNRILGELSEDDRFLFNLCFNGKLTYEEISSELGISKNSVRMRIYRLRRNIKKRAGESDLSRKEAKI